MLQSLIDLSLFFIIKKIKFGEAAAFVRSDDPVLFPESQFPEKLSDTTSAKDSPDLELFVSPGGHKVSLCATTI